MARVVKGTEQAAHSAWETLQWVSEQYRRIAGEEHTFHPTSIDDAKTRGIFDKRILNDRSTTIMVSINQLIKSRPQELAMPSSPTLPPIIMMTLMLDTGGIRQFGFASLWAARRFVDFLTLDAKTSWMTDNRLRVNDRYTITTDVLPAGLSDLLEHEFTQKELAWFLPTSMMSEIARFLGDRQPIAPRPEPEPKQRKERTPEPKAPKAPKPTGDFTSLPDICSPLGMDPKEARNILRKTNTPKPDSGRWEWPTSEVEAISKLLKGNRK